MNCREIIRYIREETVIREEQKISLIHMLYKHSNNLDSLFRWIRSLNIFASETYQELLSFERVGAVKALIWCAEERLSNDTFVKLVEIFFGGVLLFPKAVLSKLQKETEYPVKALMIQLLLFSDCPIEGSRLEDYLPGLHHRDDLFRCKILLFLYKHYSGEALPFILQEAIKINPPPSVFFYMTLNHYLRLHPEMKWDKEIKKTIWSKISDSRNQIEKDGMRILFEQIKHSIPRHEFLALLNTCEHSSMRTSKESDKEQLTRSIERFNKIAVTWKK